jgi:hypothetical protein
VLLAALFSLVARFDLSPAYVIGYMLSGTVNSYLVLNTDWSRMSRRVMEQARCRFAQSIVVAGCQDGRDTALLEEDFVEEGVRFENLSTRVVKRIARGAE